MMHFLYFLAWTAVMAPVTAFLIFDSTRKRQLIARRYFGIAENFGIHEVRRWGWRSLWLGLVWPITFIPALLMAFLVLPMHDQRVKPSASS